MREFAASAQDLYYNEWEPWVTPRSFMTKSAVAAVLK